MFWARSAPPSAVGGVSSSPTTPGRVAALVFLRPTELAVVGRVEAGAVAATGEERSFGTELQVADRVRGELLAPVFDQDFLSDPTPSFKFFRVVAHRGQPHQPAADRAGVDIGVVRFRAGVAA